MNISLGPNEDRHLMSGLHTVNNIYCSSWQLAADTGLEICKFDRILYSLCRLQVHVLLQSAYVDLDLHILLIPSVAWLCVTRKQICHVGNAIRS